MNCSIQITDDQTATRVMVESLKGECLAALGMLPILPDGSEDLLNMLCLNDCGEDEGHGTCYLGTSIFVSYIHHPHEHAQSEPILCQGKVRGKTCVCLFVCGVSLTSGQLITKLLPECLNVMLSALCFRPQRQ